VFFIPAAPFHFKGYISSLRLPSFIILSTKVHSPGKKKKGKKIPRPVRRGLFLLIFHPFFLNIFFLNLFALICIEPPLPFGCYKSLDEQLTAIVRP